MENENGGDTAVSSWQDDVYIESGDTLNSNATLLGSFTHYGLLNDDGSYSQSQVVTVPINLLGAYNLFVVADASGNVPESSTGDTISAPEPITISQQTSGGSGGTQQAPIADLEGTSITAPATALTGNAVTISWTVSNIDAGITNSNYWYDDVWLSTNTTLDSGGTDIYLGTVEHVNPLAPGDSYSATGTFALPENMTVENYYFIVGINRPVAPPGDNQGVDLVYETSGANNELAASSETMVSVGPTPQLVISNVTVPSTAAAGSQLSISWTETNNGASTGNVPITESLYLAYDQLLDPTDHYLGTVTFEGGLGAGNSAIRNASFQLPAALAGTFYVIVQTNSNNSIFEQNASGIIASAAQSVQINLPPLAELVAGNINIPSTALAGQNITVSYQVTNEGGNVTDEDWIDALYLSPTTTWNDSDTLLDDVYPSQNLANGASYTETFSATVPGVTPGLYYVILRTNILGTLPESSVEYNSSVSLTETQITAPELNLGAPIDGTLAKGQATYYGVIVPAGQTLQFAFTSQTSSASNDVYISYAAMPTRTVYDYSDLKPLQADQLVTVPNTQAGIYYILVYGDNVPNSQENYTLEASIVPFSITAVSPGQVDDGGPSTLEIDGALFDRATTFQLTNSLGDVLPSQTVYFQNSSTVYATFDLMNQSLAPTRFKRPLVMEQPPNSQTRSPYRASLLRPSLPRQAAP